MKAQKFRRLSILPLLLLLSACGSSPPTADNGLPTLPDPAMLDPNSSPEGNQLTASASELFNKADYDGLEKMGAQAEKSTDVLADGSTMPTFFYRALAGEYGEDEQGFDLRIDVLKAWIHARPKTPIPKVALAEVLTDYAWFARGRGYANTVTDQGWKTFADRLQEARDCLNEAADQRQHCCTWYAAMATVARGQSWSPDDYFKMVGEELAANPGFVDLQGEVVIYLLPRWDGSDAELCDYITKAADRVGGDEGDILYARIARRAWCYARDVNVIDEVGLSWPRLKHGMEQICNRYPRSEMMANYFCLLACQAKDRPVAKLLFQHIAGKIDMDVWGRYPAAEERWVAGG